MGQAMRAILMILAVSSSAIAAEPDYEKIAQTQLESFNDRIEQAEKELSALRKADLKFDRSLKSPRVDNATGVHWYANRRQWIEAVREAEQSVVDLKHKRWAGKFSIVPELQYKEFREGAFGKPIVLEQSLPVGDTGFPIGGSFEVGSASAAKFLARAASPIVQRGIFARVIQVWENGELLVQLYHPTDGTVGRKDLETAVVIGAGDQLQRDGSVFELGPIYVSGTRQYDSLAGNRTVHELHLASTLMLARVAEIASEIELPEKRVRTWTDATGEFSIEAKLADLNGGKVTLLLTNGDSVEVPLDKLAPADREFVRDVLGVN